MHQLPKRRSFFSRTLFALATALSLVAASVAVAAPAQAAINDSYKYYGAGSNGASIRLVGSASSFVPRLYGLNPSGDFYSIDFSGVVPSNNDNYKQADWVSPVSATALANRGPIEWILKNSYPTLTVTQLAAAVRASGSTVFPSSGALSVSNAIAGVQAAIWHFSDAKDLDLTATAVNNTSIRGIYSYLIAEAAGKVATSPTVPTVTLSSEGDRVAFATAPNAQFGPFTVTSSTPVTLSLSGTSATTAQIVNVSGAQLTGAQPSGTQFWIKPTDSPALPGSVTVKALGAVVTTTVVNAVLGSRNGVPTDARETLAALSTSSPPAANDSLPVSWVIDQNSPGSFDPNGGATERDYKYYQPGVQSATLQDLWWTDGTRTISDLIGLQGQGNASASVYSADFAGSKGTPPNGPTVPHNTTYTEGDWAGDNAAEVTWILQHSYPALTTSAFTALVHDAGFDPGSGDLKNWNSIAAAQAAIWHFTDGRVLETHRYAAPTAVVGTGTTPENVIDSDTATGWRADAAGSAYLDFTFSVPVEIRSYTVDSLEGGAQGNTPAAWRLQRSNDGVTFADVSSSSATGAFAGGASSSKNTVLGGSATYGGYSYYRLVFTGASDVTLPVEIAGVTFDGFGVIGEQRLQYRNDTQVVKAYEYLVAGATANSAGIIPARPTASVTGETSFERESTADLIGPFTVAASTAVQVTLDGAEDARLLAAETGTPEDSLVLASGDQFWVYPGVDATSQPTIEVVGSALNWVSARSITAPSAPTLTQLGIDSETALASLDLDVTLAPVPEVSLEVQSARIGDTVTISGTGYRAGETVELQLHSDIITLGTTVAGTDGTFSERVTIPTEAEIGDHDVFGVGLSSLRQASVPLNVRAAPAVAVKAEPASAIPNLGAGDVSSLVASAGLLVALGLLVVAGTAVVRRRGAAESSRDV